MATPIGNARDISLRALDTLAASDAILAEDTRVTAKLLAIHGIARPLLAYNDHNAPKMRPKLLEKLRAGARLALVSDAGTPLVSDPGMKLVREALAEGIAAYPVPGASAALAALSVAGLASDRFLFAGFLPAKSGARRQVIAEFAGIRASLIFFESPQRLAESLADLGELLGPREALVARELTKLHEEQRRGTLDALAAAYAHEDTPRGEITLVIAPPRESAPPEVAKLDAFLRAALAHMPVKTAAGLAVEAFGVSRRDAYARALVLKGDGDG